MMAYILAENLKNKRSFVKKLLFIAPLIVVIQSFILMPSYFTINSYNWWYTIVLPATISLIAGLINLKDDKKLKYKAIFPLDIDLKKIWISKIIIIIIYVAIALVIHMILTFVMQGFVGQVTGSYGFRDLLLASLLLLFANIWQIPLCLFLVKKIGFVGGVVINSILAIGLGIGFADNSLWLLVPYSYGLRLMIPAMKILPNGLLIEPNNPIIANTSILIPIVISFVLFIILTIITARYFANLEVK
ncbi:MAG: lantibiotic immunity ABC transporter MutE/EpiE family permease subunit [Tissierellia bacterium]|nr:lantibiotic immunity ABC transporter MutE/EpiE family permease subunit [Tissierellia bacterium]